MPCWWGDQYQQKEKASKDQASIIGIDLGSMVFSFTALGLDRAAWTALAARCRRRRPDRQHPALIRAGCYRGASRADRAGLRHRLLHPENTLMSARGGLDAAVIAIMDADDRAR